VSFAVVALVGSIVPAMVAVAATGAGAALLMVTGRTLLQRSTEDRVLARVFAVQEGTSLLGLALGAASVPPLIDALSPATAFAPLGVGAIVVTLLGTVLVYRLDARAVFLPRELALLRGVPFLAPLPAYELERLASHAVWLDVAADTDVVTQGEEGDRFFVIAAGEYVVTVDDLRRPQLLTAGDSFGEVALLWRVPRTATVTAQSAGSLLVVSAADFLAAVTGSPDGRAVAEEVAAAHVARDGSLAA
jgi:hypothetical protein